MRIPIYPAEIRPGDCFTWRGKPQWIAIFDPEVIGDRVTCRVRWLRSGKLEVREWGVDDRILIDRGPSGFHERGQIGSMGGAVS